VSDESGFSIDGPNTFRGAVLLLIVGLAASGYGAYDYVQQSDAVSDSVEIDAEITDIGVESVSSGSSPGVEFKPTVRFAYEYQGTSHTSTNVFPAAITKNYDTEAKARSVLEGYETGATATAYVAPDEPGSAFLKNQTSNSPLLFVGIGLAIAVVGGFSAVNRYHGR